MGAHRLAGGAAGGGGGQAVVRAPLDRRTPELEPLGTPAAIGIGQHSWPGRCQRGGGEGEVGEGRGGGDKDDEEQEQAAAPSGLGSRMGGGVGGGGEWEGLASVSGGITTIQSAAAAAYSSGFF